MRRTVALPALAVLATALVGAPAGAQQADISPTELIVLDPGAEPRQELRYRFVEGATEVLESRIDNAVRITIDGVESDTFEVSLSMTTTTTVTDVYDDGSARVDYAVTDWTVGEMAGMPADSAQLDEALTVLEGFGGWWVLDTRGAVLDAGLDLPIEVPAELSAQVDQAVIEVEALPEEPVGVGATWETRTRTAAAGLELAVLQTSQVVSIDGEIIGLEMTFSSAADPDADEPLLMTIELSGGASSDLRLDRVSQPVVMDTLVTTTLRIDDGEGPSEIVTDTATNVITTLVQSGVR